MGRNPFEEGYVHTFQLLHFHKMFMNYNYFSVQCVIIDKSDDKKTVRSRVEDSAVDY